MRAEKQTLVARLLSAQGHLAAVIKMVENDQPCEEVLHQVAAVKAALNAISLQILKQQLQNSTDLIASNPCPDQRCTELTRLLDLYRIFSKEPSFNRRIFDEVEHE